MFSLVRFILFYFSICFNYSIECPLRGEHRRPFVLELLEEGCRKVAYAPRVPKGAQGAPQGPQGVPEGRGGKLGRSFAKRFLVYMRKTLPAKFFEMVCGAQGVR